MSGFDLDCDKKGVKQCIKCHEYVDISQFKTMLNGQKCLACGNCRKMLREREREYRKDADGRRERRIIRKSELKMIDVEWKKCRQCCKGRPDDQYRIKSDGTANKTCNGCLRGVVNSEEKRKREGNEALVSIGLSDKWIICQLCRVPVQIEEFKVSTGGKRGKKCKSCCLELIQKKEEKFPLCDSGDESDY